MIAVGKCLVSDDVRDEFFCCDLNSCKGCCCVEGDMGAPIEECEISLLEDNIDKIKPFMTEEGVEVVDTVGVFTPGIGDEFVTSLIDNRDCSFLYYGDDGIAKCAIETAYNQGDIDFNKPISCHLYPIRLSSFGDVVAVNYDRWSICKDAVCLGKKQGIKVYEFLKEPLIRKFGAEWYDQLVKECIGK